jgi:hypothetical protein
MDEVQMQCHNDRDDDDDDNTVILIKLIIKIHCHQILGHVLIVKSVFYAIESSYF